jgi:hypothetical protein
MHWDREVERLSSLVQIKLISTDSEKFRALYSGFEMNEKKATKRCLIIFNLARKKC